ncbi:hypothetical protein Pcinc_032477 [Petrolisthes cinctipes]|uniref:Uncharacterized protein n=1 Tax=Petrolisthes cinctipes TaxID=88211 RepID=A0AAE1K3A5_PETCI|nr:hypothetical protein Pcinc_032477 [Petrolisthes cinctipes]
MSSSSSAPTLRNGRRQKLVAQASINSGNHVNKKKPTRDPNGVLPFNADFSDCSEDEDEEWVPQARALSGNNDGLTSESEDEEDSATPTSSTTTTRRFFYMRDQNYRASLSSQDTSTGNQVTRMSLPP